MQKLLFSLSIVFTGLIIGYIIQRLVLNEKIKADKSLTKQRRILQDIALLCLNPIATIGAIWMLPFDSIQIILLPVIGIIAISTGGISALIIGKIIKLKPRQAGAFFSIGAMTNIGSIGALVVFIFLGEEAFALVPMYKLFETIIYYAICFPIAKSFSDNVQKADKTNKFKTFINSMKDPFVIVSVGSVIVGIFLNLSKIPRPAIYSNINTIIIPVMSLILLISIGMAMKFSRIKDFIKPSLLTSAIKFLIVPFISTGIAYLLGFGTINDGLPLKVILIVTSMPVGFVALVPPSIYDLDIDLANAGWMVTTAMLVLVIPVQMLIISFM
jgi:predicted permease